MNLAKALCAIDGLDVDVFAYGLVGRGPVQKLLGRPCRCERFGLRVCTLGYLALPFYARRYDILYFGGGPFHAVLSVIAAKFVRLYPKIVYSAAGVIRKERKLHAGEETRAPYWKELLEGFVIKNADSLVCLSPLCADTVVEEWGIPRSKTTVVPLGVENTFRVADGWAKPDGCPFKIMTISQVHRYKGLEFLLLA
ncbi:MAG: glycosyltransferase family 4 protein, partial [Verrucomicrobiia bacterium]